MEAPISKKSLGTRVFDVVATFASKKHPSQDENYRTTLMNLDDYLAQPEEDRKIASKLKRLQNFIESHATYYHNEPVRLTKEEILALLQKKLFITDEAATRRLAYNLHDTTHRATFICIVISRAISMGIDFYGNPATSLHPQEIVLFMTAFKETPRLKENAQVDDVALCEWRRLGMFLLSGPKSKTVQFRNKGLRIESMLTSLDEILSPFAEPDHIGEGNGRRLENLRRLLEIAADFGVLLFGQPCGWELDWTLRPSEESIERLDNGHPRNSKVPNNTSVGYQNLHDKTQPQPPPQEQKKRRRIRRSHTTKENKSRQQPYGVQDASDELQVPVERLREDDLGSALQRTTTNKSDIQRLQHQHQHPSHAPPQQSFRSRSTQQGGQSFAQKSRSGRDSPQGYYDKSLQHGSIQHIMTTQNEVETPDSRSYIDKLNEVDAPPTPAKDDVAVEPQSDDDLARSQEPLEPRSGETRQEESFLDGPEDSRTRTEPTIAIPARRDGRPITYFPALVKINDEYGCKLSKPIVVSEPAVDKSFFTVY